MTDTRPTILIADPEPREIATIFEPEDFARLESLGRLVIHADGQRLPEADLAAALAEAEVVIGQIDLPAERLAAMPKLRAVINVESNFLPNIDYATCFARGVHVLAVSPVFSLPVAETALGMAIDLARGITATHEAFRRGEEAWGLESNEGCFVVTGAPVGIVGLGELGSALRRLIAPFRCPVKVYDPWQSERRIREQDCIPAGLDEVLSTSRIVFLFASVTSENQGFIGARELALLPDGACLLVMSRAGIVDFPALEAELRSGRIRAGLDVFPVEPLPRGSSLRGLPGVILSSHRSGGVIEAFRDMGRLVVADTDLVLRGLPPQVCRRAERETVARMRSQPVAKS